MTVFRLSQFNELQAALIKSMYKQVRFRCNDGKWRTFKADITVNGKRFNFEAKFKLDNFFLTLGHCETRDNENRILIPDDSIQVPVQ